jgi:glucosamine--fructose-6-phosphate aminotransferase (isomerizing)
MCGIIGVTEKGSVKAEVKSVLIQGLKRLEYRGYDSAGFALVNGSEFLVKRCSGPVEKLEESSRDIKSDSRVGIAHTRWATHGAPSEINAHPHIAGDLVLVHNGILENYSSLRERLQLQGVEFLSQTDTEVYAKVLEEIRKELLAGRTPDQLGAEKYRALILEAVKKAVSIAEGHYAVLFMVKGLPDTLFAVQCGAPLVAGKDSENSWIASDLQALLPHTKEVFFLPLQSVTVLTPGKLDFYSTETLASVSVASETLNWSAEVLERGGYETFMLKEIHQQPLTGRLPSRPEEPFIWDHQKAHEALWKNIQKLTLVACGTSYHAALVAKHYFERWAGLETDVEIASEFRYRNPILRPGTVVGVISQSGETADTLAALRLAKERGATTFSICNVPASTISRESHFQYPTKAGPEVGVASTKAFTAQLTVLCAMALDVARHRGKHAEDRAGILEAFHHLARLPHDMEKVLAASEKALQIGAGLKDRRLTLLMGRGTMVPIAMEGALKFKELTYLPSEGYAAGELKHGPIAYIDETVSVIVLLPDDPLSQKTLSNLEEIKARGGHVIGIGSKNSLKLAKGLDESLELPEVSWGSAPALYVLPLQLMAYGFAAALGRNIDKPRNLAKSVTVE